MNSDGSNQVNLTNHPATDGNPAWSPDGQRIVFTSDRDGDTDIYVMNTDGSNPTRVTTTTATESAPKWSPDGTRLVFASNDTGTNQIYTVRLDGTERTQLTSSGVNSHPAWSGAAQRITFTSNRDGNDEIYSMKEDGSDQLRLTTLPTSVDTLPTWSPDGQWIAFRGSNSGLNNTDIWIMQDDGSNLRNLTNSTAAVGNNKPSWSPDGTKIAFYTNRDGNNEIYVMNADGSDSTRLIGSAQSDINPDWQPIPNAGPATSDDTIVAAFNTISEIDVLANDTDEEALDPKYLTIKNAPGNGTAAVVEGKVRYSPNNDFTGADQLTYQICDSFLLDQKCSTGVLTITVQASGVPVVSLTKIANTSFDAGTNRYTTSAPRPVFTGTASPFAEIRLEIHSDPLVFTTTANADGHWSITPDQDLPAGEHTVYITATKDGVTTELDSFVLSVTAETSELPNTGQDASRLRASGLALLLSGIGFVAIRRPFRVSRHRQIPPLFP